MMTKPGPDDAAGVSPPAELDRRPAAVRRGRVLIIDDEPQVLAVMKNLVSRSEHS